jgi:hypothetical protein
VPIRLNDTITDKYVTFIVLQLVISRNQRSMGWFDTTPLPVYVVWWVTFKLTWKFTALYFYRPTIQRHVILRNVTIYSQYIKCWIKNTVGCIIFSNLDSKVVKNVFREKCYIFGANKILYQRAKSSKHILVIAQAAITVEWVETLGFISCDEVCCVGGSPPAVAI